MSLRFGCTICYENYKRDDEISNTNCGHVFHMACIQEWLNRNPANQKCPICIKPNLQVQKLYLNFEDKLTAVEAALDQCVKERSELQKQYSEFEVRSNEQIAYLTLQKQCCLSEIEAMKKAEAERFADIQRVTQKKVDEFLKKILLFKEEKYALELKVNYLLEKYELRCREITDLKEQRAQELLKEKEEKCQIFQSHVKELYDIIDLCKNISNGSSVSIEKVKRW